MSDGDRGWSDPRARTAAIALAITLAIQVFTSLAATATSVLAPEIGRDLGFAPKLVGAFVGLMYAGGMSASLASGGFIERYGAIRVSQVCVLFCAAGLGMVVAYATASRRPPADAVRGPRRHRAGLRADHAGVVADSRAHGAPGADGAHVLDQADGRAGRCRACRCAAARRGARSRLARRVCAGRGHRHRHCGGGADCPCRPRRAQNPGTGAVRRRRRHPAGARAPHAGPAGARDRRFRLRRAAGLPDELPGDLSDRNARLLARCGRIRADRREPRRDRRPDPVGRRRGSVRDTARIARAHRDRRRGLRVADRGFRRRLAGGGAARRVRGIRRDRDRLEWRAAFAGGAPRARRSGRNDHRRRRIRHLRRGARAVPRPSR